MDEMQMIKDLRRSTPEITPDAGQAARARLLTGIAEPARSQTRTIRRRHAPRLTWRWAVAGALATAVAAGAAVTLDVGGNEPVANAAAAVLDRASAAAASRPFTPPRPGQWVYQHTRWVEPGSDHFGMDIYRWTAAGAASVFVADAPHGRLRHLDHLPAFPPQDYATVSSLPREPDALLRWIRTHRPPTDRTTDFEVLSEILRVVAVVPPKLEAATFQAMKKLPGVTVRRNVQDLRGRPAIAVVGRTDGAVGDVPTDEEVLLDPGTYAYRGDRILLSRDLRTQKKDGGTEVTKAGTVNIASEIVQAGIVDKPGRRP
ncbi:CU044_5270 family protein [Actinoallomurus sp. CA-150999]|uniref:CU044_5270 family protein n=1 Tax=Actinoallomurus sp. CA-150999 TaxID=3239887 RepID=UPI003D8A4D4A